MDRTISILLFLGLAVALAAGGVTLSDDDLQTSEFFWGGAPWGLNRGGYGGPWGYGGGYGGGFGGPWGYGFGGPYAGISAGFGPFGLGFGIGRSFGGWW